MELHRLPSSSTFLLFLFILVGEIETVFGEGFRPTKLFVFGDSYADTGNHPKSTAFSWKIPYGITFPGKPAGRYSDGRVFTDYIAEFMGIKSPLPYKLLNYVPKPVSGINFAYGATGVFDTGLIIGAPNMTTQIGSFEGLIKDSIYTKDDLESSLALVTVSGNDYASYIINGGSILGLPKFMTTVVNQVEINLKQIHDLGVPKVLVNSLQPLGCVPFSTITYSYQKCDAISNALVELHNKQLQGVVAKLNNNTNDASILVLDFYNSFNTVIKNKGDDPGSLKFDTPLTPCCIEANNETNCGSLDENGNKLYTLCDDPESAFFWDTVHPTQAGWRAVYTTLLPILNNIFS